MGRGSKGNGRNKRCGKRQTEKFAGYNSQRICKNTKWSIWRWRYTLSARPSTANILSDEGQHLDDNENSEKVLNESQFDRDETTQQDEIENSAGFRTPAREKLV
ncbi:uncharacterized protein LOC116175148 [Photinus pyralis]|uniref:uncharacterized protein LOC116175148 n=1 Tax=Photinus pyralis TaxID=7054 RepID=UPI0012674C7A|nr:uncharacterized protein LOC116175148 [Photinus pyralis]